MKTEKIYSTHLHCRSTVELLLRHGVRHAVISSGSRNAPLVISISSCPEIKSYSVIDERSAAFFAMGIARETSSPVALVCTSGSAVLNYYPAVAEAYYSRIPLVVLSADRPADMIDKGMGQTIHQDGVMALHTTYSTSLKEGAENMAYNIREVDKALRVAKETSAPVHINIPFAEPLYTVSSENVNMEYPACETCEKKEYVLPDEIKKIWSESRRRLIICGAHERNEELERLLRHLNENSDAAVLCENISNVHGEGFVENIDRCIVPLSAEEEKELFPDLIVSIGGMVVSKKVKAFLCKASPRYHIHIHEHVFPDTYGVLSHRVKHCDKDVLLALLDVSHKKAEYTKKWMDVKRYGIPHHDYYVKNIPFSDMKVWDILSRRIPSHTHLEIANSSSIRYSQLFDFPQDITFWCNRGTSGIDGSTSTAIGTAVCSPRPTTLISGDLSFFYDSNALWNKYIPRDMRFVVINNGGGGIFKILDGSRDAACCEEFLQAKHSLSAVHLAEMHSLIYDKACDTDGLERVLKDFWTESPAPRLLEIFTPADENDTVLRDYFKYLIKNHR